MRKIVKIKKGIPLPKKRGRKFGDFASFLKKMEISDSIKVADFDRKKYYVNAKRIGIKVSIRKTEKGYYLWRVM